MPDISLVKFDGKPLEKLIDVVSKGIGDWRRPKQIRKEADAEAYKIKAIEKAKTEASLASKEAEIDFYSKIEDRLLNQEKRRQQSIDNVIYEAAKELQNETVNDEPVNQDWAINFFNFVQDVTDDSMQLLWAKILAGETKKPKSFSLRTLEALKLLSKDEAEIFIKTVPFLLRESNDCFIFYPNDDFLERFGITFDDILKLNEIGLLPNMEPLTVDFLKSDTSRMIFYHKKYGLEVIYQKPKKPKKKKEYFSVSILTVTKVALELSKLVDVPVNAEYLTHFKYVVEKESFKSSFIEIKQIDYEKRIFDFRPVDTIYPP